MRRPILILVAAAVLVVLGFVAFVIGTGGPRETPLDRLSTPGPEVAVNQPQGEEIAPDEAATERFDAWAERLRGVGLTVETERVSNADDALLISGLAIAGPSESLGWRWSAASARLVDADEGGFELTISGDQTLTVTSNGEASTSSISADTLRLALSGDPGGPPTLAVSVSGLTITGEVGAAPIALADGELSLTPAGGQGLLAAGSTAGLRLQELVLPGQAGGPLGTTVEALAADLVLKGGVASFALGDALKPWMSGGADVTRLALEWGTLDLEGSGTLAIDAMGRPAGLFDAEIRNILSTLDAFHAVRRFDRELLADVYGALLVEMGDAEDDKRLPFKIAIGEGTVRLLGEPRGLEDVVLGEVQPLIEPGNLE